jgi:hypothetical protein
MAVMSIFGGVPIGREIGGRTRVARMVKTVERAKAAIKSKQYGMDTVSLVL